VRKLLWISVAVVALSIPRPHLTRLLDASRNRASVGVDSNRPQSVVQEGEHFSPWEDLEQLDIAELRTAKETADIAMYSFTDGQLAEVVRELGARHVRVRLYRDQAQYRDEQRAALRFHELSTTGMFRGQPSIQVRVKQGSYRNLMHQKAYRLDPRVLRDGSANWSPGGEKSQDNNARFTRDTRQIEAFERAFESMWSRRTNLVVQ
jgi:phosphatidylserine/phosphatidylglycerophosphate/cardiolipin synthase-like enzyme